MRLIVNATPLCAADNSFHVFLSNILARLCVDPRISALVLHIPTVRRVKLQASADLLGRAQVVRHRLPARMIEECSRLFPFAGAGRMFAGADLYWNPHHVFYVPRDRLLAQVTTVHGCSPIALPSATPRPLTRQYQTRFERTRRSNGLVHAVSEAVAADLITLLGFEADSVLVSHNGVDPLFRPLKPDYQRIEARFGIKAPYALCVGTLHEIKNQLGLVRAWPLVSKLSGMDCSLVLAGALGPGGRQVLEAAAQGAAADKIKYLGSIPHSNEPADLLNLYCGAQAYVQPSLYEGCCLTVCEALACGVPVACSDIPNLRGCLGPAATYFDPLDTVQIADRVSALLGDAGLRKQVLAQSAPVLEKHALAASAERMIGIFSRAVERSRR